MTVRFATIDDLDTLIHARYDYFNAEGWELTDDKKSMIGSQLQRYYKEHINRDFFVALVEDCNKAVTSLAFLVISEIPANPGRPTGKTGTLLNVLTYSQFRGMGYATRAINLLIDKAKENDLSFIGLSASEMGKPLYEKLGFRESETSHFTEMRLSLLDS